MERFAEERLGKERKLLDELPQLGDLHCAWVLLSQSAALRSNHLVRILPRSLSEAYALKHDAALWETFCKVFGVGDLSKEDVARNVATLPGRLGGLGLRSATRTSAAAYWASWVNSLPVFQNEDAFVWSLGFGRTHWRA